MSNTRENILRTLAYFDIFQYPLTKEELFTFHETPAEPATVNEAILNLLLEKQIFKVDEFYSLLNNRSLAERRRIGNSNALIEMKNAFKAARLLSRFPYVKGLAISGSLSKNYADENTDVDFFVITTANRLWIARTIMHVFYKLIYFSGRQKWFCMNYYVDELGFEIPEKNIFTAMEIVTLVPIQGRQCFNRFIENNQWTKTFFPLANNQGPAPEIKKGVFARCIEWIFNTGLGNRIDDKLMTITKKRWQKKAALHKKNKRGIEMGMMVDKHYSKPDPKNFQQKVIDRYNWRVEGLLKQQVHF